ncbi:MAG: cyclase family protein [Geminicoccaceae bacterium]|nr:cyclase family protein [Geminicoccaceae bacterium]MCS7267625.1 cyclase family protein [Geminicoccaceae bacterium]MCX7630418.1 cyclase family protein [Geminicoccaceae bacterium]MDW8123183.1 cyclase family protein [Geminicoccaceae bacterium]MDW8340157.1 cyclase family protein [Geminicoccaceae bacterium]
MRKTALLLALGLAASSALAARAIACTPEDWKACKGKPWVDGEVMETPLGSKWWPHPLWGAGDEAGSTNWYRKPEVVLRAIREIDKGRVYKLAHPYDAEMPLFGSRRFSLRIPGTPTGGPFGANKIVWHDEFLATEIGQVGTQFDGLGHIGVQVGAPGDKAEMRFYNGFSVAEIGDAYGLKKLGAEKLYPIVARGVLLDIAGAKGVEMLEAGYEITMADVRLALEKQGMKDFKFEPGDAILFYTGWSKLWKKDNAKYNSGEPGWGMEVARWMAEQVKAGVTVADTWAGEVVPNPDPACAFCVHQYLQTRHGIVHQENAKLDELVRDKVWVFAYIYSPVPITGATGSIGAPLAID